jgi:hypothetical protein
MSYNKPQLVMLDSATESIQGFCKKSDLADAVISGNREATSSAYEADE